jgi:hypothetical protein
MVPGMNTQPFGRNRLYQTLSEEGIYYVLEPTYRRLAVGNAPTFPAIPELNEMGQMTPAVKHVYEDEENGKKIQMRSYTKAASRKLDRDCGTATGILLS